MGSDRENIISRVFMDASNSFELSCFDPYGCDPENNKCECRTVHEAALKAFNDGLKQNGLEIVPKDAPQSPDPQPIETAPKDGTEIIGIVNGRIKAVMSWQLGEWCVRVQSYWMSYEPDQWLPLPSLKPESEG